MGALDHWHPVLLSRALRRRPAAVRLHGRELVLFRGAGGAVGALDDVCPHRRSRLSTGAVVGDKLRCQYHGWTFDAGGRGESPGTPKMSACAASYDAREEHGLVWVKPRDAAAAFPALDTAGYRFLGHLRHRLPVPLEVALDNFTEIEHTTLNHSTFGYDEAGIAEVTVRTEATADSTSMLSDGPTKRLFWLKRAYLGAWAGARFHSHTHTWFSPVYSRFDHFWTGPGGRETRVRWRVYMFFVPVDAGTTDAFSLLYARSRWPAANLGWPVVGPIFVHETRVELDRDRALLGNLADPSPSLEGMKLSRFDKILGLNRERIGRIYRGQRPGHVAPI